MNNEKGITLIELIVVISIIGILVIALGFSFQGWIGGYKVESQIKEMYVDLMNARASAMMRNRMYFVSLNPPARQYTIYEDSNPLPDGDGTLQIASDRQIVQKTTSYDIIPALALGATTFNVNKDGLISNSGSIRFSFTSSINPDYDCVVLSATRINIGQMSGGNCAAK